MNNFPEITDENMGGCLSFRFAPYEDVLSFPTAVNGVITSPVIFKPGKGFLTGYASPGSLSLDQDQKDTPAGPAYTVLAKAFYPGSSADAASLFAEMAWHRYILEITDASGKLRLAGTPETPLRFIHRHKTGSLAADRSGYETEFSTVQAKPCPYYELPGQGSPVL
jgi:hypothetical protein